MKRCPKCGETKPFELFAKDGTRRLGMKRWCKSCDAAYKRKYYAANLDKERARKRIYGKANPDKINAKVAKRHAQKLKATPRWLTPEDNQVIQQFYRKARELAAETGIVHHVDHIVPLQGKEVCGLHVPQNLQVIPASENIRKRNKLVEEFIYG